MDAADIPPPLPPSIPRRIGTYRIERLLGTGGMSEVYRAWDEERQHAVAMKRLVPEAAREPRTRRRFRREARAMVRIHHPAVVKVFDVIKHSDVDWLVMELVEGETLAEYLEQHGPPDVERARRIALQIAEGLEAAHARGVIHRDLKTENVFLARDENDIELARIFDFGLAKDLWESNSSGLFEGTEPGTMIGTCRGMAPEQALSKEIDHRADLFSFGVLLYEMLAGRAPFQASTPLAVAEKIVNHEPPPVREYNPDISPQLSQLIADMLGKRPEQRPSSASQVAATLAAMAPEKESKKGIRRVVRTIRRHLAGE